MPDIWPKSFDRLDAYKKVFLDAAGNLSPDAEIIIDDLCAFASVLGQVPLEPLQLAANQGRRDMLSYILFQTGTSKTAVMRQLKNLGELNRRRG